MRQFEPDDECPSAHAWRESLLRRTTLDTQEKAIQWLAKNGLLKVSTETTGQYVARLTQARSVIKRKPRPGPRDWAADIVQATQAGKKPAMAVLEFAKQVFKVMT